MSLQNLNLFQEFLENIYKLAFYAFLKIKTNLKSTFNFEKVNFNS